MYGAGMQRVRVYEYGYKGMEDTGKCITRTVITVRMEEQGYKGMGKDATGTGIRARV